MTAAELDAELAWHAETAKERLLANGEVPMMVVVRGAREMAFLPLKSEERLFNQRLTRIAAIAFDADSVSMISEAWTLALGPGEERTVAPSQSERRIETLVCFVVGHGGHRFSSREIIRDDSGRAVDLKPDTTGEMEIKSWLCGCLPINRPPAAAVALARAALESLGALIKVEPRQ